MVPGDWIQDNWQTKVVTSVQGTNLLSFQEIFVVLIFGRAWFDPKAILGKTGLCKWKIPMTPAGIETATFRLVEQCLNQLCLRVLQKRHQLLLCPNLFIQRLQPSAVLQWNTNRYDSYSKATFITQAAYWYRLLTADEATGSDPSICFPVTSRVLPHKIHKINKRTCNV